MVSFVEAQASLPLSQASPPVNTRWRIVLSGMVPIGSTRPMLSWAFLPQYRNLLTWMPSAVKNSSVSHRLGTLEDRLSTERTQPAAWMTSFLAPLT